MENGTVNHQECNYLLEKVDPNRKLKRVEKIYTNLSSFGTYQECGMELQKSQNCGTQFAQQTSQNGLWFKNNLEKSR